MFIYNLNYTLFLQESLTIQKDIVYTLRMLCNKEHSPLIHKPLIHYIVFVNKFISS